MATASTRDVDAERERQARSRESGLWLEHEQETVQQADGVAQHSREVNDVEEQLSTLREEQQEIQAKKVEASNQRRAQEQQDSELNAKYELSQQKQRKLEDIRRKHRQGITEYMSGEPERSAQRVRDTDAWITKTNKRIDAQLEEGARKQFELHDE